MLEAVLFDWGGTLAEWTFSDELLVAGHAAGLAAIGRDPSPELTERYRADVLPVVEQTGEYRALVRAWLGDASEEELDRYLAAEYEAWRPAHQLGSTTHALLETLRGYGLKLGLVSNGFDPPELAHAELERLGIAERLDVAVMCTEVGVRKPDPAIFRYALDALGVEPERALFVGDSLAVDIAGAAAVGMHTCQAMWFNAEEDENVEPEFRAFTQMDVITAVRRFH